MVSHPTLLSRQHVVFCSPSAEEISKEGKLRGTSRTRCQWRQRWWGLVSVGAIACWHSALENVANVLFKLGGLLCMSCNVPQLFSCVVAQSKCPVQPKALPHTRAALLQPRAPFLQIRAPFLQIRASLCAHMVNPATGDYWYHSHGETILLVPWCNIYIILLGYHYIL